MTIDRFAALGLPAADAASRASLVGRVVSEFAARVGAPPAWCWHVPGRIEVFGKHTDYAGGRSLLAAVPRGFAVAARPRSDAYVRVLDVRHDVGVTIDPADTSVTHAGWSSYVQVVARRFATNFPGAPLGADIAIASDLPRAAGLSSSSALVVGIATALARRGELAVRDEWIANIAGAADLAWYLGCVENGLDYRGLSGTAGVGTHGGSEDHTAILACRTGRVSQYRFVPVAHLGDVPVPSGWRFVVAASGVHADKAGSVREHYNRASLGTRALLACWNAASAEPAPSLGAALSSPGASARLAALAVAGPRGGFSGADLDRRLRHFVAEDARVEAAAAAFAAADASALGDLSADSQRDADDLLGNQVPETRALAELARACGAFAATSFGAGFGGSVWALVEGDAAERFAAEWMAAYARRVPHAAGAECFVARPGPALIELPVPA